MVKLLGQILVERGKLSEEAVLEAVGAAADKRLGAYLVGSGKVSERDIHEALAEQFGLPFVAEIDGSVNETLLRDFPSELFKDGRCFPLESADTYVNVVMADPLDFEAIASVELASGLPVAVSVTTPSEMARMRDLLFEGEASLRRIAGHLSKEYEEELDLE